ncbi:MAG: hypothetical protein GY794_08755 [bacterium]|nr:hypothetical protein [bacterium]
MNQSGRVIVVCVGVLLAVLPLRIGLGNEPTTAPAKVSAEEALAAYIHVIKTSDDPAVVLRAYTRACTLSRTNPDLNSAYMRRMLRFGRPRAAYMAAKILSTQEADAGLAWALVGYMTGRANNYLAALTATARALEFNSDDPSTMNNVGQLAAWFDNAQRPPRLGDREKRIMDKLKTKFQKSKEYKSAYDRVNAIYVGCKTQRADLTNKLIAAEVAYNKVRAEELAKRAEIKRINAQIIQINKRLSELDRDLRSNRNRLNLRDEDGRYIYNQRAILDEHTRIQRAIDTEQAKKDALRKEGAPIHAKIPQLTTQGTKLRKDIGTYKTALKVIKPNIRRQLRWDPPSVDGVFTPETTKPLRPSKPGTRPVTVETGAEAAASRKLKVAKLYASNKKYDQAQKIVLEIIEKYPKTKAAAQAKELAKSIKIELLAPE